jgi:pimeloyl-ACP methyl ester carboxylesterase
MVHNAAPKLRRPEQEGDGDGRESAVKRSDLIDATRGKTFLVAHGAWSAAWSWKKMHPLMQAGGHRLIVPTFTGLGERAHLSTPAVNLETHIQDVLGVIRFEELNDIVLVAHSYGGLVATGVADRVPERIRQLIYIDAFVPRDGQSMWDLVPKGNLEFLMKGLAEGDGWRVLPMPVPADTSPEDKQWIERFRMPQPLHCFDMPLKLTRGDTKVPRTYIYAQTHAPADPMRPFADRAKREGWGYHEIDASHSPQVTAPGKLAPLLNTIAA